MSEELALATRIVNAPLDVWTEERVALAVRSLCPGATPDEAAVFILRCRAARMDPFLKHIYFLKDSKGRVSHIVGIDGLRLVAQRTGDLEGMTSPEWKASRTDTWSDTPPEGVPYAARVGVWRKGFREPVYHPVTYQAFARETSTWKSMPAQMLAVRAESHALRKAFPAETAGLTVTFDEDGNESIPIAEPDAKASNQQLAWLHIHADERGWDDDFRHQVASEILGRDITTFADLTKGEAHQLREAMEGSPDVVDGEVVEDDIQDSSGVTDVQEEPVEPAGVPSEDSLPEATATADAPSPDGADEHPPSEASGSDTPSEAPTDFNIIGGEHKGRSFSWIAENQPEYLRGTLKFLTPVQRAAAEWWLAWASNTAGGEPQSS